MTRTTSPLFWESVAPWQVNDAGSLLEAAQTYARAGVPVFPLRPRHKDPLVPKGVYAATCDLLTIRRWWERYPDANIGMPAGRPSDCWVLDVDPRHGGLESLERLRHDVLEEGDLREMPAAWHATRVQLTGGGGVHLCYRPRQDLDVQFSNAVKFAGYSGLDLQIAGGYVVVAPSRHQSGGVYRWLNDRPLLPFPQLLVEAWRAHRRREFARPFSEKSSARSSYVPRPDGREADPDYWLRCAVKYGVPGCRRAYALFLAFHLIDDVGLLPEDAESYLISYACQVPQDDHPFSVEEALNCLYGAARKRGLAGVG